MSHDRCSELMTLASVTRKGCSLMLLSAVCSIVWSCGYHVVRTSSLPFDSFVLESVENHTSEPGLQDLFRRVFTEETLKQGLDVSVTGGPRLRVTIRDYELRTISIKKELTAEYEVDIKADVQIVLQDESLRDMRGLRSEFMETFVAPESIQALHAQREIANEEAIRNLSQRIIAELIYRNEQ